MLWYSFYPFFSRAKIGSGTEGTSKKAFPNESRIKRQWNTFLPDSSGPSVVIFEYQDYQSFTQWSECPNLPFNVRVWEARFRLMLWFWISVGTILIFQFSPGFSTEASVPAVPLYRFWYLGSGSYFSIPGSRYMVFKGLFAFVSFWYCFGSLLDPFQLQIRWNLKLWYSNLNWLESKLFKIFGTKIQKMRFFRYSRF